MTDRKKPTSVRIGVVTISDRASSGEYEDLSGPAILDYLESTVRSDWTSTERLVSDEPPAIAAALLHLCDAEQCCLVITTGGTGPGPRDRTPEVTSSIVDRLLPGFGERMRQASWDRVPTAILSRQLCGVRGSSVILNLPGHPKAIKECLDAVVAALPHCVHMVSGLRIDIDGGGDHDHV